jgi:predicted Zn-dependent protease
VTIDTALGLLALGLAFGVAAIRARDLSWALLSIALIGVVGYLLVRFGLVSDSWMAATDRLLILVGLMGLAITVTVTMGLSKSTLDRLIYGPASRIARFDRAVWNARRPFVGAAATWDASMTEKAAWRAAVSMEPPSDEWASLADRIAAADRDWAAFAVVGDTSAKWGHVLKELYADWVALRDRDLGHGAKRARRAVRLAWFAVATSATFVFAGHFSVTNGLCSGPPSGRAAFVPATPLGQTVQFVPLGNTSPADLQDLAAFYAERYDLKVEILSRVAIPRSARDATRDQLVAEALIEVLRSAHPEVDDPARVVIGVTSEDIHIREKPDWSWAFGLATEGHLAVLSTARMGPEPGPFGHQLEAARLRKMVTKYIGLLYFDLPLSSNPQSVLYRNILGVPDLDAMGEDF